MSSTENALAIIGPIKPQPRGPDSPLPMDQPAMEASAEAMTIDLTAFESRIEPPESEAAEASQAAPAGGFNWRQYAPLAASVALAALIGVLGGAGAVSVFTHEAPAVAAARPDETHALQERVAKLSAELAALKSAIDAASKASAAQLNRIGERLDRAEKAQTEPAAKLAKIAESLDRLERRTAAAAAPDVTGSVTSIEKQQAKPPVIDGWRLRDYYAGRAVLESRNGTLFEVGPGSNLPGLGRVETIKRVDGKIVVTTPKGVIASSFELPRRPPYYLPYGR